ncbi:glyoxalase [Agromyces luteolus]|uniref:Glyoxalase n=1 Tax=Agromyces luteolus TaxID=88373 RepID=A0A7C9HGC2_9MICO|nr:VOC family protein [Agromyces luteolus]MUN06208.1 glyoxalase [Agromyces luteolus]GLK26763.1 glyoxalase [Agromyces luteolus]
MHITATALSLNVPDVDASSGFLQEHFGFEVAMSADGFASLTRPDSGVNVIFLRAGLPSFKPATHREPAGPGLLVVFVVDDIDAEWARLRHLIPIATPIETEPWGERYFQVLDPNGIVIQLVQWVDVPEAAIAG